MAIQNNLIQSVQLQLEDPFLPIEQLPFFPFAAFSNLQTDALKPFSKDTSLLFAPEALNSQLTAYKVQNIASAAGFLSKNSEGISSNWSGLTTEPSFSFPDIDFNSSKNLTLQDWVVPNQFFSDGFGPESMIGLAQNPCPKETRNQGTDRPEIESKRDKKAQEQLQTLLPKSAKAQEEGSFISNPKLTIPSSPKKRKQTQKSAAQQTVEPSHAEGNAILREKTKQTQKKTKKSESSVSQGEIVLNPASPEQKKAAQQEYLNSNKSAAQIAREYAQKGILILASNLKYVKKLAKQLASLREPTALELETARQAVALGQGTPANISKQYAKNGIKITKEELKLAKQPPSMREATAVEFETAKEAVVFGQRSPIEVCLEYAKKRITIPESALQQAKDRASWREATPEEFAIAREAVANGVAPHDMSNLFAQKRVNLSREVLELAKSSFLPSFTN